ncbi:MAG TPA: ribosomal protein L7/L12 [Candidatus Obscuribacterales bacterium]
MYKVKSIGAGVLLVLGFWCLGRAVETGLNADPQMSNQREIMTAGVLLGVPATAGGGWLLWDVRQQRRREAEKRLRDTFFKLVKAGRGKVTPLRLSMEAQIDGETAKAYLRDRSVEYDATFQVDMEGHITYCFHLGEVDSRLLRAEPVPTFDVILEAVPPVKRREVVKTVHDLTGLDWDAVKALVRQVPQPIQQGASRATAEEFRAALEKVGAQVALVLSDRP